VKAADDCGHVGLELGDRHDVLGGLEGPDVARYAGPAASPARELVISSTQVLYTAFPMAFYGPFLAIIQADQ